MQETPSWLAGDLSSQNRWLHHLSADEISDLDRALRFAKSSGRTFETLDRESFPITAMRSVVEAILDELEDGSGTFLLRGFPVARYTEEDVRLLYWGIGLHLGTAVSQSTWGEYLADVRNDAAAATQEAGRGYTSGAQLGFHTDICDVVGLFVLRTAKAGGESLFCSSLAIHDEIRRVRPDLLAALFEPMCWSWMDHETEGQCPFYRQPFFSFHAGKFSSRYAGSHLDAAARLPGTTALTAQQIEGLELVAALANDPRFHVRLTLEAGDFQFLNNHVTYHARTAYDDHPEANQKRHLLRLWLSPPNSRELSPQIGGFFEDRRAGAVRGGFPSRTLIRRFRTGSDARP